jgi:hypothetical protein
MLNIKDVLGSVVKNAVLHATDTLMQHIAGGTLAHLENAGLERKEGTSEVKCNEGAKCSLTFDGIPVPFKDEMVKPFNALAKHMDKLEIHVDVDMNFKGYDVHVKFDYPVEN